MTSAEYLELLQMSNGVSASHAMNAVTVVFAYVIAVYFTAKLLTKFQIFSVTLLYSVFLIFPVGSIWNSGLHRAAMVRNFADDYPEVAEVFLL
jgi:hypothetical protein